MKAREVAILAAGAAERKKALRVVILDVTGISTVTDYFVIASADNRVQLRAIADNTLALLRAGGIQPHHVEGYDDSGWILVDCGDVVVHYFLEERREFYALERLWGDSARVEFLSSASPNDARSENREKGENNAE